MLRPLGHLEIQFDATKCMTSLLYIIEYLQYFLQKPSIIFYF